MPPNQGIEPRAGRDGRLQMRRGLCTRWRRLRFFRGNLWQIRKVLRGRPAKIWGDQTPYEKLLLVFLLILKAPSAWNFSEYFRRKSLSKRKFKQSYIAISAISLTVSLFYLSSIKYFAFAFAVYRAYDIVVYRLYFFFVKSRTDPWKPIELYQSLFIVFINIYETIVAYAIIYLYKDAIVATADFITSGKARVLPNAITALYYSAITLLTVGYGDFVPKQETGRIIVLMELATGLVFLAFVAPALISAVAGKLLQQDNSKAKDHDVGES